MTFTPILGEYQPTKGIKKATKSERSDLNLDESSSILSVKGIYSVEAVSVGIKLPPSERNSQLGDSDNARNSNIWQYLTELMLDGIRKSEKWKQEIPTPPQIYLRNCVMPCQDHPTLNTSKPKYNPRGSPNRMPCITAPVFGYSSGVPSGSPSDNLTKDPSALQTNKTYCVRSESPTRYPSHAPK